MNANRAVVAHPFLLPLYSVLAFYAYNIGEMSLTDLLPIAVAVCGGSILLFGLSWLVLRNAIKAGLVVTAILLIVLFYGHISQALDVLFGYHLRYRLVFPLLILLLSCVVLILAAKSTRRKNATTILNWMTAVLVLMPMISIVEHDVFSTDTNAGVVEDVELMRLHQPVHRPHVFYLILDRYAANRTLRDQYQFDNQAFEDFLSAKGFFIATDSYANYLKTAQSLAATFDMRYLDELAKEIGSGSSDLGRVYPMLTGRHRVLGVFEKIGYQYVHMGSWWEPTRHHIRADESYNITSLLTSSEAIIAYSKGTVKPFVDQQVLPLLNIDTSNIVNEQCRRVPFQFEALKNIVDDTTPKFVFAHFLIPHDPYVFNENGRCMTWAEADERTGKENYIGQVKYVNQKIHELVDVLLSQENKPIVIIQADEGPFPERYIENQMNFDWRQASAAEIQKKFRILNAMYLPGVANEKFYNSISPVNTFRLVFNEYLGADLPLLEDRSYAFIDGHHKFDFFEVTEKVR